MLNFRFDIPSLFLRSLLVINTFRLRPAYVKTRKQDVSRMCKSGVLVGVWREEKMVQTPTCKYTTFWTLFKVFWRFVIIM